MKLFIVAITFIVCIILISMVFDIKVLKAKVKRLEDLHATEPAGNED